MARRIILIGCGGLVGLVVLVVVIAAIIGPQETAKQTKEEPKEEKAAEEKPAEKPPAQKKETEEVIIRVTGDPGLEFSGNYLVGGSSRSVDGVTPQDFPVEVRTGFLTTDTVSTTFQKRAQDARELRVQIIANDEVQKEQNTTAQFGVVSLTWNPSEMR